MNAKKNLFVQIIRELGLFVLQDCNMIRLLSIILFILILPFNTWASSTRKTEADSFISSDHSKTWSLPNASGTLLNANSITGATNLKITYSNSGLVTAGTTAATSDLSDVSLSSLTVGDILKYNGSNWYNGPNIPNANASAGVNFFFDDAHIINTGTNNVNEVNTLLKTPNTITTVVDTLNLTNNTVLAEAYLYNTALGGSQIDGGEWASNIYCSVNSTSGGRVSSITTDIYKVVVGSGTITTTGTAGTTTRTATASTGSPFVSGDANANITLAGYLQTPQGLYQITAYTSATVVTIAVPSTYANESTALYNTWKYLFGMNTGAITTLNTNYGLITTKSAQSTFNTTSTDKLGITMFATSNNTTTVNFTHNGTTNYSYVASPLLVRHNDLQGLQGGTTDQYYHLTSTQYTNATQNSSTSLTGLLSNTDWNTFNNKVSAGTPTQEVPSGSINGSNQTFTLLYTPISGTLHLYLDGIFEIPTTHYTISTATISMIVAPAYGQTLYASYTY